MSFPKSGSKLNVILDCGEDSLTIWFVYSASSVSVSFIELPQFELLTDGAETILGFRFCSSLKRLCPYELIKICLAHSGTQINALLQAAYDRSCDMGYIHLDKRGAGSVKQSVSYGSIVLDVGDDGAIIGIEVFSPSKTLPLLTHLGH